MVTKEFHFKEDASKPENRTNLALLSVLQIREIFNFLKIRLDLIEECLIYPCPNLETEELSTSLRPDFKIENYNSNQIIGYIEVELGPQNDAQIKSYKNKAGIPIYSIVGKACYSPSDLSLEEIYNYTKSIQKKYLNTQMNVSIKLFCELVKYYVIDGNFNCSCSRSSISTAMLESDLVQEILSHFKEDEVILDAGDRLTPGKIKFDTVSENGFSLRIFCRESNSGSLSLMNRSGGGDYIGFPSYEKLNKYLPSRNEICKEYADLISNLGDKKIFDIRKNQRARLPLSVVENNIHKFVELIRKMW